MQMEACKPLVSPCTLLVRGRPANLGDYPSNIKHRVTGSAQNVVQIGILRARIFTQIQMTCSSKFLKRGDCTYLLDNNVINQEGADR